MYCSLNEQGKSIVQSQALYTTLPPLPSKYTAFSPTNQYLLPMTPSQYAPLSPMLTHPSISDTKPTSSEYGRRWSTNSMYYFADHINWSEDPAIKKRREGPEGKELDWGAWCEFTGDEKITTESLA